MIQTDFIVLFFFFLKGECIKNQQEASENSKLQAFKGETYNLNQYKKSIIITKLNSSQVEFHPSF